MGEKKTGNFFSKESVKCENPFDQRPAHLKDDDKRMKEVLEENERLKKESRKHEEIIRRLDQERWYLTHHDRQSPHLGAGGYYNNRGRGGYYPSNHTFYTQPSW